MTCICDNCGWKGSAEALQPIQDFQERMGTASECAATFGIALMPEGECPECGCLTYIEAHETVWRALRAVFDEVAQGYTPEGRIRFRADEAGRALFHAAHAVRTLPVQPPRRDGERFDVWEVEDGGGRVYLGELWCHDGGREYLAAAEAAGMGNRVLTPKAPDALA